ncbi:MAG: 6,7-dimethyl-8-ribityllumazine synthase [Deltaproteobacteria bacterium]|nr:6,7-dimethyl-8-ribityllumazine synthase [Deltaproteobacteria bacterium]
MRTPSDRHGQAVASALGCRAAIVVSQFNADITGRLLEGALEILRQAGIVDEALIVVRVPGAFEIPVAARWLAGSGRYDGVLCLGCVIRGGSAHYEHIARECARGIQEVAMTTGVPAIFGVLTVDRRSQAEERAGGALGNMGCQGAQALVEMMRLKKIHGR